MLLRSLELFDFRLMEFEGWWRAFWIEGLVLDELFFGVTGS